MAKARLYIDFPVGWLKKKRYYIYPLPCNFPADEVGNYVFARTDHQGNWVPIYIGEGSLHIAANFSEAAECAIAKGATYFMAHLNNSEEERKEEVRKLLKKFPIAFEPKGCNPAP